MHMMTKRNTTIMLTCGHQIKHQLDIGNVGATRGRTTDPCALDRVRAGYLVPVEREMVEYINGFYVEEIEHL